MNYEELEKKYLQIPKEIKETSRWICYTVIKSEDGEERKIPMSPFGGCASSTDPKTWSTFSTACFACAKYNFLGLGFVLGYFASDNTSYFGIDLDNHPDKVTGAKLSDSDFNNLTNEFIGSLNSYSEYSHSGKGVHIICKGTLPNGARRKLGGNVEMYDSGRYFTMTGKTINNAQVEERTEEIKPLWEKYLNVQKEFEPVRGVYKDTDGKMVFGGADFNEDKTIEVNGRRLDDDEIIEKIRNSKNASEFIALFNGDMSAYGNDHSYADFRLCQILAFWTNGDRAQMDRIFRSSALYRKKWDEPRRNGTYGLGQINDAINKTRDGYVPPKEKITVNSSPVQIAPVQKGTIINNTGGEMKFDEYGDPVINYKKVFKTYPLTDTGNAERFYDQFGDIFKYNKTGKYFMFWNGKKWIPDEKEYIKKYADKLIEIMRNEAKAMDQQIKDAAMSEDKELAAKLCDEQKQMFKNIDRISNKAGKDAMLSELEHLHDIPTTENEYDTQGYLLNTNSGIVNLETGEIMPFNRKLLMSKSTNCDISYETPTVWIKFLHDIFRRDDPNETDEIVNCVQKAIGYCLTDSVKEQCMFILHGDGSNGKSTFIEELCRMLGDYGVTGDTDILVQNKNNSGQSTQFSLAGYKGTRLISVSETDEGSKLAEARIKAMTGNAEVRAQQKYGKPFTYPVTYKIWLATNPKPIIRGTDLGIWRRVFYFPFERKFTDAEKDTSMPEKLMKETPQILGWAIEGYKKYKDEGLKKPKCIEEATSNYRKEMDVINAWISSQCSVVSGVEERAAELFADYKQWARDGEEYLMPNTKFGQELIKKGYKKRRKSDGFYYIGLKLNSNHSVIDFTDEDI